MILHNMKYLIFLLSLFPFVLLGQSTITVVDKDNKEPLIGANIVSNNINTVTDIDGQFVANFTSFPDTITVSYIGYSDEEYIVTNAESIPSIIYIENNLVLETMTVTASKYERRLSESTVSLDVLKPELIANSNTINIDDALDKVSGVQMVDGQANIRGGSGYSYGAGSRVMLLVDDMPALQADAGFPNWGDMPVENIDQVEIVKGASSALYGSAALNGIINIRTGTPTSTPQTKLVSSYTSFGTPRDTAKQWWGDTARYEYVLSAVHKQKFGKLDAVGSIFHYRGESYQKATYNSKYRLGLKLKYRISDKIFVGLNFLSNTSDNGDFFIWSNSDHRAYLPIEGGESVKNSKRYFIDPSLSIEDKYGNNHKLLTRYHSINNDNSGNQANQSKTLYGEYQFQRNLKKYNTLFTSGIVSSQSNTDAQLFGDTTFTTKVFAYYAQMEKSFFDKLNVSAGARYEYNEQNTPDEFNGLTIPDGKISAGKWIARLGASYEYMPFSSIRASWGQGFRFPTITERFITTTFGIFKIEANPDLVPESGWTSEIGIKQGIKLGGLKGFVDFSAFTSEYQDMMEFTFGFNGFNPSFTSQNVGNTRINGVEASMFATANLGDVTMNIFGGYTYIDPIYTNYEDNDSLQYSLSADQNVLKYRSKHNAKIDLQFNYHGFSFGVSHIRNSHVINIDAVLEGRGFEFAQNPDILGLKKFREEHPNGWKRWDVRFSYEYQRAKLSFLIENLTNEEYIVRPAYLEAPRSYSFRLDYAINWKKSSL